MLFTQFNLEDAKKIWYEEAFEDGEERGLATDRSFNLIEQVQRKARKKKHWKLSWKNWKYHWKTSRESARLYRIG